jgi:CheY-like chemotaxis protein
MLSAHDERGARTLLLVHDDEAKRHVLGAWLRRAGHTVMEVGTGCEALATVSTADLVLLDVNLPDMSGFDVCRQIKTDPRTAAIPVIQVSATAVDVADRAIGDGQGHSLHAAAVMGELRHALRAFATESHSPVEITSLVNEVLRRYHPGMMATLCPCSCTPGPASSRSSTAGTCRCCSRAAAARTTWAKAGWCSG